MFSKIILCNISFWARFYLWPIKALANERGRSICYVFDYWSWTVLSHRRQFAHEILASSDTVLCFFLHDINHVLISTNHGPNSVEDCLTLYLWFHGFCEISCKDNNHVSTSSYIIVTPHERHSVSSHGHFYSLFSILFRSTKQLRIISPFRGIHRWIPLF